MGNGSGGSLKSGIWDAACSIRGAKAAAKLKEFILPLISTKRLCDVFDDELNRITEEVGSRAKAFKLVKHDKKLKGIIDRVDFKTTARGQSRTSENFMMGRGQQMYV